MLWGAKFLSATCTVWVPVSRNTFLKVSQVPISLFQEVLSKPAAGVPQVAQEFWDSNYEDLLGLRAGTPFQEGGLANKSLLLTSMIFLSRITWASRMVLIHIVYTDRNHWEFAWDTAYLQGKPGVRITLSVRGAECSEARCKRVHQD